MRLFFELLIQAKENPIPLLTGCVICVSVYCIMSHLKKRNTNNSPNHAMQQFVRDDPNNIQVKNYHLIISKWERENKITLPTGLVQMILKATMHARLLNFQKIKPCLEQDIIITKNGIGQTLNLKEKQKELFEYLLKLFTTNQNLWLKDAFEKNQNIHWENQIQNDNNEMQIAIEKSSFLPSLTLNCVFDIECDKSIQDFLQDAKVKQDDTVKIEFYSENNNTIKNALEIPTNVPHS